MVKALLHLEGATIALACGYLIFFHFDLSWWWLPVFLVGPDLSMIGYLFNPRVGAALYNAAHTYAIALPITFAGFTTDTPLLLTTGLLLTGHAGIDRAFGFGLKYPTQFKDTHFNRLQHTPESP